MMHSDGIWKDSRLVGAHPLAYKFYWIFVYFIVLTF